MNSDLFSFFAGSRIRWVFLWLVGFGFHLQAQPKTQVDILRKQFGWPTFDSILKLNPAQRCLFLENTRINSTTDKSTFRHLVTSFRKNAESKNKRDALLMADLFDYYDYSLDYNISYHARRHITFLEKLHLKAGRNGVRWYSEEVDLLLAKAYLSDIRKYESGLFLLRELVELPQAGKNSDSPQRQNILMILGLAYFSFNDQQNALYYFRKALNTKVPPEMKSDRSVVFLLNNLGLCFRELRQLDSSDYYFRKELLFTRIKQDSIYEHITLGNLGENQYLRGKYDEAIPLLQADADMANKLGDFSLASNALILLGDIYTRKGQYRTADSLLSEGLLMTRRTQSYRRKKKAFPIMAGYYLKTGQSELAALFLDSSHFVADSLVRLNNQSKISAAEADYAFQNLKIKAEREASDLRFSRFLLAGGLLFAFMLGLMGLIYFQRYRISARLRQLELQANLDAAENDLEAARRKLDEYLKQFSGPASADVNWTESRILTRENWLEFKKLFSASFPGFLENIPKKFPQLTEGEVRYCCLLRLNLKVKDIALILGVNENSAYRNRSRLLAKTDLPDDKALLDILLKP
jgi:Tfp pilus assembly protein PilF/DNA-binding CsgD family transcriptional regulator